MYFFARGFPVAIGIILVFSHVVLGEPVIVYDNSQTYTHSEAPDGLATDGFFPFNYYLPNEPMGDEIMLADTDRVVVQFDLILSSTRRINLSDLTLTLRQSPVWDDEIGWFSFLPEHILCSKTLNDIIVDGVTTVPFTIPNVTVPDTLVWIAESTETTSDFGLATCDSPTVGASWNDFWLYSSYEDRWHLLQFGGDPVANFGATVWAVPEPAVSSLLLLGGLIISRRKKTNP